MQQNVFAQDDPVLLPRNSSQYFNNFAFTNPAAAGFEDPLQLRLNFNSFVGSSFNNVNRTLLFASLGPNNENVEINKVISISIQNEQEGEFLNRFRGLVNYLFVTELNENLKLNAGGSLGLYNFNIRSSNSNAGGSAMALDGKFGLFLYESEVWGVGLALNQIFNNSITPFDQELSLQRYVEVHGDYAINTIEQDQLKASFRMRLLSSELNYQMMLTHSVLEVFEVGAGYLSSDQLIGYLGFEDLELWRRTMNFGFSYTTPIVSGAETRLNLVELSLFLR